jgi:hypothetical protein
MWPHRHHFFTRFLSCLFLPARSTDASVVQDFPLTQYFPLDVDVSDDGRHVFASFNGFDGDGCTVALWDRRSSRVLHSLSGHEQVSHSRLHACSSLVCPCLHSLALVSFSSHSILDARSTLLVRTTGGKLVLPAAARRRRRPVWRLVLQGRHGARLGPDARRLRGHAAARGLRGADLDSVRAVRAASVRFVLLSCTSYTRAACLGLNACVSRSPSHQVSLHPPPPPPPCRDGTLNLFVGSTRANVSVLQWSPSEPAAVRLVAQTQPDAD